MKLKNFFGFLLRVRQQPKRLPDPCLICKRPMKREGLIRFCPQGHRFRDGKKRPHPEQRILNDGIHRGVL